MAESIEKQSSNNEEDDYMGDLSLFLPPDTSKPSKPSFKNKVCASFNFAD